MVIVGKISFEPQLVQTWGLLDFAEKNSLGDKAIVMMTKTRTARLENYQKADQVIVAPWDKYFAFVVPRKKIDYWAGVYVMLKDQGNVEEELYLDSPFKINAQPGDRFIYLGDFVYRFGVTNQLGGKSNILVIRDDYSEARSKLGGSYVGANGRPLTLVKRIPTDVGKLSSHIIETQTVTY